VDLDLDALKNSIVEQIERSEFAVFRHDSGAFDPAHVVTWDIETYPDFQLFLDAARKLGVRMILFAADEFSEAEISEAEEELEDSEVPREERRDYQRTLDSFRTHVGTSCSIELAFAHDSYFYVYEARADWYEEFAGIQEEIALFNSEDDDVDDSLGGFYSKN